MSVIDFTASQDDAVTSIRVGRQGVGVCNYINNYTSKVFIEDCHRAGATAVALKVENKEHALNIIKGLHKAVELGWLK